MITPELARFIESGISVLVGTRDARLRPDCVRAAGVRADAAAGTLTVFLPAATAERALANLADNGRIAVTVTRAIDHRSLQIKGGVVEVRPSSPDEQSFIERYLELLAVDWGHVGVPRKSTRSMNAWPAYTVHLRAETLFEQTPGPDAGQRLTPEAAAQSHRAGAR
ncbi:pyridoxamine 5'-phosphate oxidase family protein [Amaricoccus sp.]|uniref:pyridoxamine 5'-phosphate oxidase family protein n=1 Tax=Amaricoccus sp. TaxID=1872485 RepID=UPI001B65FC57|nr:pyridoxamine 5'-phosphate oxidase family protein [Amaricoccus sp.]MBP7243509.1 pyridoxamine 5'-phosphate oxidase family protein [Amaricoccus sp.]